MRYGVLVLLTVLSAAPAWAAPPALWQWQQMDLANMKPMSSQDLSAHIGDWVYAPDGSIVGSLAALQGADDAVLHVSVFFSPGNQPVVVPAHSLGIMQGKLVIHDADFSQARR